MSIQRAGQELTQVKDVTVPGGYFLLHDSHTVSLVGLLAGNAHELSLLDTA
jgi:hypothetical protein